MVGHFRGGAFTQHQHTSVFMGRISLRRSGRVGVGAIGSKDRLPLLLINLTFTLVIVTTINVGYLPPREFGLKCEMVLKSRYLHRNSGDIGVYQHGGCGNLRVLGEGIGVRAPHSGAMLGGQVPGVSTTCNMVTPRTSAPAEPSHQSPLSAPDVATPPSSPPPAHPSYGVPLATPNFENRGAIDLSGRWYYWYGDW